MKRIICPTDFSVTALNAVNYAAEMAEAYSAELLIINVMHVPAVDVYSPASILNDMMEIQRKTTGLKLDAIAEDLKEAFDIEVKFRAEFGFAAEVIAEIANEQNVDLIILGTTGANSAISRFLGSVSYDVAKRCEQPVILVPADARYQLIKHIAVANDKKEAIDHELAVIHSLFGDNHLKLDIITVEEDDDFECKTLSDEGGVRTMNIEAKTVANGICQYVNNNQIDLLALKRHHRNFIENLLHRSTIKQVIGRTHIPTMVSN